MEYLKNKNSIELPKISVITICYNEEETIRETIESVVNQKYHNLEYIVIDGGSNDKTPQIISEYKNNINIFVSEKDNGIYDAMNKGGGYATGDWVIFMNGGDRFCKTDVLLKVFKNNIPSYISVVYGNFIMDFNNDYKKIKKQSLDLFHSPLMPSAHEACFVKEKYLRFLQFNYKFKISGDLDFFRRLYIINPNYYYIDIDICYFKINGGVSTQYKYINYKEYYHAINPHSKFNSIRAFVNFFLRTIKNSLRIKKNKRI